MNLRHGGDDCCESALIDAVLMIGIHCTAFMEPHMGTGHFHDGALMGEMMQESIFQYMYSYCF